MAAILTSERSLSALQARTGGPSSFGQRLWAALEALGRRRAAPHIDFLAYTYRETNPELSRQLSAAAKDMRGF